VHGGLPRPECGNNWPEEPGGGGHLRVVFQSLQRVKIKTASSEESESRVRAAPTNIIDSLKMLRSSALRRLRNGSKQQGNLHLSSADRTRTDFNDRHADVKMSPHLSHLKENSAQG